MDHYIGAECVKLIAYSALHTRELSLCTGKPFGVIAKSEPEKWRLILDLLSFQGKSVSDDISKELCSLSRFCR